MKLLKRLYWKWKFLRISKQDKLAFELMGITPDQLIKRGEL